MKTLVLTGYDDAFKPLGDKTAPLMHAYAQRHDFDFQCLREPVSTEQGGCSVEPCHPSWWKMLMLPVLLLVYERVIWIDADIVITNPEIVPPGESGYHCSRDWGFDATEPWMLSNGCFVAFPDSVPLIRWVLDNRDNYDCTYHEQEHMRATAKSGEWPITVHPRRVFNAVPIEIHPSAPEPWQPGDWCAHLTMVDLAERVRLVDVILKQAKAGVA